jgi:hypothetical protein
MTLKTVLHTSISDLGVIEPLRHNPHAKEAEAIAKVHCQRLGIHLDNFDGYNSMSAFLYPRTSLERLVAIITIMNLLYYIDEAFERHERVEEDPEENLYLRKVFQSCVPILLYGETPKTDNVIHGGCKLIHDLLAPLTTVDWLKRFVGTIGEHLMSTTYTLKDVIESNADDMLEKYIDLRRLDCGMNPTMNMAELAYGFYLPDTVKAHPFIKQVEAATANIAGLMNDLFSYEKEVIEYGSRFNLIAVLMDYKQLTFEDAVAESVAIVNQNTNDFLRLKDAIPSWENKATEDMVRQYVDALEDQISATWYWQQTTDRYRSPTSPFPELRI